MTSPPPQTQSQSQSPSSAQPVYNKNSLVVTIQVNRNPGVSLSAQLLARFRNTSNFERLTGVGLQAAVPKSQKLVLQAINRSVLEGGEEATQAMRVAGVSGVSFLPFFLSSSSPM